MNPFQQHGDGLADDLITLPSTAVGPVRAILRRLGIAGALLLALVLVVVVDRGGYNDTADGTVSIVDAIYYATVSLSTTGYGDITPVSTSARVVNIVLVTPLRIGFLIILVGTTVEVLTERSRRALQVRRWRAKVDNHVVVCGYGTKGRSAIRAMIEKGARPEDFVVVDPDPVHIAEAGRHGVAAIEGDATREEVLRAARVDRATKVVVAPRNDDTAVLITLTAREMNPTAVIVAAVRETENAHLLTQSGANSVITSSDAAGRLLGLATDSPRLVAVVEDLLAHGQGLDMVERVAEESEEGLLLREVEVPVLAIVRNDRILGFDHPGIGRIARGDRLICLSRNSGRHG